MLYITFGPYKIETKTGNKGTTLNLDSHAKKVFWDRVEIATGKLLREARGIYVFAEQIKFTYKPWYVGQAKEGFAQEVFNSNNTKNFQNAYAHEMTGDHAVVFLLARMHSNGETLARSLNVREADFVEQEIIGHALRANGSLINTKNTKVLKTTEIRGVLNSSDEVEFDQSTKRLRRMLGLRGVVPSVYAKC